VPALTDHCFAFGSRGRFYKSMNELIWILVGGLLMSAIAMVGAITTLMRSATLERVLLPLVSLAAGTLIGGAVWHLIPLGMEQLGAVHAGTWLFAGFTVFLGLEQLLHWHHCHRVPVDCPKPMTYLILVGDTLHNFLDGLSVASAFLIDARAGITAWFAAAAHEVPQELGDFGILVHGGWPPRRALFWNFISALMFPLGAVTAFVVSLHFDIAGFVLFGAGNFLYVGASDLIPEIKTSPSLGKAALYFSCFAAGALMMLLLAHDHAH
jgi:zinc and cadmium transporter